jgi:excisionase family DNA binding protein
MRKSQDEKRGVGSGDGRRRMLTIREACELLSVHGNTLRRWSDQGLVRAYRIGLRGDRRFRLEDIDNLLTEQTRRRRENAVG